MEKAGKRNSSKDMTTMQEIMDKLKELMGADDEEEMTMKDTVANNRLKLHKIGSRSDVLDVLKSENLDKRTMEVRQAFDKRFGVKEQMYDEAYPANSSTCVYVQEVWDTHVIACIAMSDETGYDAYNYQVEYQFVGDECQFADPNMWTEVELVWQPKKMPEPLTVTIGKSVDEKRLIYGVVLKPEPFVDSQGDIMTKEDIELAAHDFMRQSRQYDLFHKDNLGNDKAVPVESYIASQDLTWGNKIIPQGSWVIVTYVKSDEIWDKVKKGEVNAYSIKGYGKRQEVKHG